MSEMHPVLFFAAPLYGEVVKHLVAQLMAKKDRKTTQFNFRLEPDLRDSLDEACAKTREDQSSVLRCCIEAFIEAVERDGEITKPYAIVGKKRLKVLEKAAGFTGAGERKNAGAAGPSTPTRVLSEIAPETSSTRLNDPPAPEFNSPAKKGKST